MIRLYMKLKSIFVLIPILLLLILSCGCSAQPQASSTMERVEEDGTLTRIEPVDNEVEYPLSAEELIAKQDEISSLLKELTYIEDAVITLTYRPEKSENPVFASVLSTQTIRKG